MAITYHAGRRLQGTSTDATAVSGGWKELGRTTLGSASSSITVSSLPNKRYYKVLTNPLGYSPSFDDSMRFNGDATLNYARSGAYNGTNFSASGSNIVTWNTKASSSTTPSFAVGYIANKSNKAKLVTALGLNQSTAGHGVAPMNSEIVGKWANSSDAINSIQLTSTNAGTYPAGSEMVVLGYDPDDTHTTNFWEQLDSFNGTNATTMTGNAFTPKKYLWIQGYLKPTSGTITPLLKLGSGGTVDTTGNYSLQYSFNGAGYVAMTNTTAGLGFFYTTHGAGNGIFFNTFIVNNSGQDKLCISEINDGESQPDSTRLFSKWTPTTASDQANIVGVGQWSGSGTFSTDSIIKVWGSN
jgi:hypothetical protein